MMSLQNETYSCALVYSTAGKVLLYQSPLTTADGISGISVRCDGDHHKGIIEQRVSKELQRPVASSHYRHSFALFTGYECLSYWSFYQIEIFTSDELPESCNLGWYTDRQIQELMRRTEHYYLHRTLSGPSWQKAPGLSLPWYRLLRERVDLLYPVPTSQAFLLQEEAIVHK